ncbi:hypothetical protein LIG30_0841, partial [Burkholderia sp. lig30]
MKTEPTITPDSIAEPSPKPRPLAAWGFPAFVVILGAFALAIVWVNGAAVGLPSTDARKTASLWIVGVMFGVVLLHGLVSRVGAYELAGATFRTRFGADAKASDAVPTSKRDARLQFLVDELRTSHGWRWRNRTRWLLVNGADALIEGVAPGLKRAGAMPVGDVILVHAAPDGIDAAQWRRQIRQLRRRRPVDSLIQVVRLEEGSRSGEALPRTLAGLATDLGWAAPVTFLHAVPAQGSQPDTFDAIGAFPGPALKGA